VILSRFYVYGLYTDIECLEPFYIGKGTGNRILEHEKNIEKERKHNFRKYAIIKNLLKTLGLVPKKIIYDKLTEEKAFELEKFLIAQYGRVVVGTGKLTNLCEGGFGSSHSPEAILKIRAARAKQVFSAEANEKRRLKSLGRKLSDEAKARMSAGQKALGRKHTEEQKQAQREKLLGRKHTDEARAKMSAKRKGRKLSAAHAQAISRGQKGRKVSDQTLAKISFTKRKNRLSKLFVSDMLELCC
jgi:hypothetical protein